MNQADATKGPERRGGDRSTKSSEPGSKTRWLVLAVMCVLLLGLGLTGVLSATGDTEITRNEAVAIAEREGLDFEPTETGALLLRQGFSMRPVWAVSFRIPDPEGGSDDFLRIRTVEVDARSGDILRVGTDGGG